MRNLLPSRFALLLVLVASVALARGPESKVVIRTEMVSDHPAYSTNTLYVSGHVATVVRFEKDVDPSKTKLLGWEGRFEPLLVGSKKVVVEPIRDLDPDEALPLLVTLVDGTEIPFLVKPRIKEAWGWTDQQVNVFKDSESFDAVLSSLYDSLKRERELREENERIRKENERARNEEKSVDHAYATLLINGEVKKTPFRIEKVVRLKKDGMEMVFEVFSGPGKAAAVVTLSNTHYGKAWEFDGASLTDGSTSFPARPFALRVERSTIVPRQTGTVVVVVDKSAFESQDGKLVDHALQIFRGDGLLQVAVTLEHTLIRQ